MRGHVHRRLGPHREDVACGQTTGVLPTRLISASACSCLASAQSRPSARWYGAIVRILNVRGAAGRPVRVDDGLVDDEQPGSRASGSPRQNASSWSAIPATLP